MATIRPVVLDKWDKRFLQLAKLVSTWSKDPSTQVGAVIVDEDKRVVSLGYNGLPKGVVDSDDKLNDRPTKYRVTLHAEANAILFANRSLQGCTIFIYPLNPCAQCAAMIVQVGMACVVTLDHDPMMDSANRWANDCLIGASMFLEAGVSLVQLPRKEIE